jgi:hypothetical protein
MILGRALPGILQCRLWEALSDAEAGPTFALVTDIGNDILYGHPVDRIAGWVEACIDRLLAMNARIVVASLPIESLVRLGPIRYHVARQILFPTHYLGFREAWRRIERLDEKIRGLALSKKVALADLDGAWYGLDPIHIMKRRRREAWESILGAWREGEDDPPGAVRAERRFPSLRFAVPDERWILGVRQHRDQPWRCLQDGSTVSAY